jgi:hypothetical protein
MYNELQAFALEDNLTPKGHFFSKKYLKFAIYGSRSPNKNLFIFAILTVRSCPRLLGEHVQKVSKKLTAWIVRLLRLKWKEKFSSLVLGKDNKV